MKQQPDLFLFLGDNIYADGSSVEKFREHYRIFGEKPEFQAMRTAMPILATWDDHDYGPNDSGVENPIKHETKDLFMDFFEVPADSPIRTREGIYDSKIFEADGNRLQVILLDTRWFRSALTVMPPEQRFDKGKYGPSDDPNATVLGAAQWHWLEAELQKPADLRIIVSSIQIIPNEHGFEKWANFPAERTRFFELLAETDAGNVVILSGDRHFSEISELAPDDSPLDQPLVEVTASALNQGGSLFREPNRHRVSEEGYGKPNFGWMEIDWSSETPKIAVSIRDAISGESEITHSITAKN